MRLQLAGALMLLAIALAACGTGPANETAFGTGRTVGGNDTGNGTPQTVVVTNQQIRAETDAIRNTSGAQAGDNTSAGAAGTSTGTGAGFTACDEASRSATSCQTGSEPVCASVQETGGCQDGSCPMFTRTYRSACTACLNPYVNGYTPGACAVENQTLTS